MTNLTQAQQNFVKQELIDIIWLNLEADWKSITQLISENLCEKFEDLDEDEALTAISENLDLTQRKSDNSYDLDLTATYQN